MRLIHREIWGTGFAWYVFCISFDYRYIISPKLLIRSPAKILPLSQNRWWLKCGLCASLSQGHWLLESYHLNPWSQETVPAPLVDLSGDLNLSYLWDLAVILGSWNGNTGLLGLPLRIWENPLYPEGSRSEGSKERTGRVWGEMGSVILSHSIKALP